MLVHEGGNWVMLFGKQALASQRLQKPIAQPGSSAYPAGVSVYGFCAVSEEKKKRWFWPWGLLATGLAGAGVVLLRGCWHGKMSWPVRAQKYSYQVCLGCGIKRLFDEHAFRAYGPYSYDLNRLIAWDQARQSKLQPAAGAKERRTAS
jgi:hypothetical protein